MELRVYTEVGAAAQGECIKLWAGGAPSNVGCAYHPRTHLPPLQQEQGREWDLLTHIAEGLVGW